MRLLFEMDLRNYDSNGIRFVRPSVRGIIINNDKIAMVYSQKYDYYKFPGGGIEEGEDNYQALAREVREEAGLAVIPSTITEFGCVRRIEKGQKEDIFEQDNFYYICQVEPVIVGQMLDDYEADEHFTLEYVLPEEAIDRNRNVSHGPKSQIMLEREARVLEILIQENYFSGR